MTRRPDDIRRGEKITASFLNDAKNAPPERIIGGPGILVNQIGGNTVITLGEHHHPQPGHPRPVLMRVKSVAADYLICNPVLKGGDVQTSREIAVAKPPGMRSGEETWGVTPPYIPFTTDIYAIGAFVPGVTGPKDIAVGMVDMNVDGRTCDVFDGKIISTASAGDNKWTYTVREQMPTTTGWTDLPGGREVEATNGYEANNSDSGVQGNGVDLDGQIFTDNGDLGMVPFGGSAVVEVKRRQLSTGEYVYRFFAPNLIDGECAA